MGVSCSRCIYCGPARDDMPLMPLLSGTLLRQKLRYEYEVAYSDDFSDIHVLPLANSLWARGKGVHARGIGYTDATNFEFETFQAIKKIATPEDLELLTHHPSSIVRVYALEALFSSKTFDGDINAIIEKGQHLFFDIRTFQLRSGSCGRYQSVNQTFLDSIKASTHKEAYKVLFDRIVKEKILCFQLLQHLSGLRQTEENHTYIRNMAIEGHILDSIYYLACYKRESDVGLIMQYLLAPNNDRVNVKFDSLVNLCLKSLWRNKQMKGENKKDITTLPKELQYKWRVLQLRHEARQLYLATGLRHAEVSDIWQLKPLPTSLYFGFKAVCQFPHPSFFPFLERYVRNHLDAWVEKRGIEGRDYYEHGIGGNLLTAIMKYNTNEALELLQDAMVYVQAHQAGDDYGYGESPAWCLKHGIYLVLVKPLGRCPNFDILLLRLVRERNSHVPSKVMDYLRNKFQ